MKEELVQRVNDLHNALKELNEVWDSLDWSRVPDTVSENYPFHQDLKTMEKGTAEWLKTIIQS